MENIGSRSEMASGRTHQYQSSHRRSMTTEHIDLNRFIVDRLDASYLWIERLRDDITDEQFYYQPTADSNSIAIFSARVFDQGWIFESRRTKDGSCHTKL